MTKRQWETGDTCPSCNKDSMVFTEDFKKDDRTHGVLSCRECGWFDDMVFVYDYQIPSQQG